jgi:hypothetical protein
MWGRQLSEFLKLASEHLVFGGLEVINPCLLQLLRPTTPKTDPIAPLTNESCADKHLALVCILTVVQEALADHATQSRF